MRNETAIITGSTSGIGKKMAEIFLKEGCKVAICSRNVENVQKTLEEFKGKYGDNVIGAPCDVMDIKSIEMLVSKTIEAFGSIRVLVANAGINSTYGPFKYLSLEEANSTAKKVIGTNLIGVINTISAVLPEMVKNQYGRIITLTGGGADRPMENMIIYSASKGGVVSYTKCLAQEFKTNEKDIKINIYSPGMLDTNLSTNSKLIEEWKSQERFKIEMDLIRKHVMADIEKSVSSVIPYVMPSCNKNGKEFRGFSLFKLIKGFRKMNKELKEMDSNENN